MKIFGKELGFTSNNKLKERTPDPDRVVVSEPASAEELRQDTLASLFKGGKLRSPLDERLEREKPKIIVEAKRYLSGLIADVDEVISTVPEFERSAWQTRKAHLLTVIQQTEAGDLQAARVEVANTMISITDFFNTLAARRNTLGIRLDEFPKEKILRLHRLVIEGKSIIESIDPEINTRNGGSEWIAFIPDFLFEHVSGRKPSPEKLAQVAEYRQIRSFLGMLENLLVLGIRSSDLPSSKLLELYNVYLQQVAQERTDSVG